jgi:hypothetical protein
MKYVAILESLDGPLRFFNDITEEQASRPLIGISFIPESSGDESLRSMKLVDDGACPIKFDEANLPDYFDSLTKRGIRYVETMLYSNGIVTRANKSGFEPHCGMDQFKKYYSAFYRKSQAQFSGLLTFKKADCNRESVFETPSSFYEAWEKLSNGAKDLDKMCDEISKNIDGCLSS